MIFEKEKILNWDLRTSTQSKQSGAHGCFSVFPKCTELQKYPKLDTKQFNMYRSKISGHTATQVKKVLWRRWSAGNNAHVRSSHELNLQLSSSNEQFWVSRGNLLKSMKHIAETVILQEGTENQKVNEKFHTFSGLCSHLIEIPDQPAG